MKLSSLIFDTGQDYDLSQVFEMAECADAYGFKRFWLGEHYDFANLWSSPEPLIPVILGLTERITVGAAGMLLKLHSPFRVASAFKLINVMYPERVDLGMAAGTSGREETKQFLMGAHQAEHAADYYKLAEQLVSFLNEEDKHIEAGTFINPTQYPSPNLWLLSTGFNRTEKALNWGANYSKSMFHKNINNTSITRDEIMKFKDDFFDKHQREVQINIGFSGIMTHNDQETKLMQKHVENNEKFRVLTTNVIGTPNLFFDKLNEYREYYQVNDFTFLDFSEQMSKRIENIQILSEHFQLNQVPSVGSQV